jgi:hypothetical protein
LPKFDKQFLDAILQQAAVTGKFTAIAEHQIIMGPEEGCKGASIPPSEGFPQQYVVFGSIQWFLVVTKIGGK